LIFDFCILMPFCQGCPFPHFRNYESVKLLFQRMELSRRLSTDRLLDEYPCRLHSLVSGLSREISEACCNLSRRSFLTKADRKSSIHYPVSPWFFGTVKRIIRLTYKLLRRGVRIGDCSGNACTDGHALPYLRCRMLNAKGLHLVAHTLYDARQADDLCVD
jgi:hypothetical protein